MLTKLEITKVLIEYLKKSKDYSTEELNALTELINVIGDVFVGIFWFNVEVLKQVKEIKKRLEEIRHEKGRRFIDSENPILQQPNIFKEDPKKNILKQKSIFSHKSNNLVGNGMFFK